MRYAMSGSALAHVAVFGMALLGFAWPQPDDAPPPGALTVDIVTTQSVSANSNATLEAAAAENQVAAGTKAISSQAIAQLEPERLLPRPLAPLPASAIQPLLATPLQAIAATPVPAERLAAVEPQQSLPAPLEPIDEREIAAAPVPHTLSFERPAAPTQRAAPSRKPNATAGNGGQNDADSAASKPAAGQSGGAGGGGGANMARWESQVRRALASARRYPRAANGAAGDVTVRFVVSAAGALSGLSIVASSGNPVLDQAALDTVRRAAPFPSFPDGSDLTSRTVQLPLGFVR